MLQLLRMLDQFLDRLGVGVVLVLHRGVGCEPLGPRCRRLFDDSSRDSDDGRASGHVLHHHGIRAHLGAVADRDRSEDLGACADDHPFSEGRMALALVPGGPTERDPLIERRVVADLRGLADHHAHAVVDEHPPADGRAGMDFDPGDPAAEMRGRAPKPPQAAHPEPMGELVQGQRVQPGIAGEHLPRVARRRIALEYACDVFTQMLEHEGILWIPSDSINYSPDCFASNALSSPRRMLTSSRSRAGTRENRRRQRSRRRDPDSGARKPLASAACSRWAYSPSMSAMVASFPARAGGTPAPAATSSSYATTCT